MNGYWWKMLTLDAAVAKTEAFERIQAERGPMSQAATTFVSALKPSAALSTSVAQCHTMLP